MTTNHDIYNGYFIPKGPHDRFISKICPFAHLILDTIVFANIWYVDVDDMGCLLG